MKMERITKILHGKKALKTNLGVDANFLNDRLRTSFDYYHEKTSDIMLSDGTAPSVLGLLLLHWLILGK